MSHKELSQLWNKTVAARPGARDIIKTMHLSVLAEAVPRIAAEGLHTIQVEIHDFILYEMKGRPQEISAAVIPTRDREVLWLGIQLHGKAVFSNGSTTYSETLYSFTSTASHIEFTLPKDRQWMLLLGVWGSSKLQLLAEIPALRRVYEEQQKTMLQAFSISNVERQTVENLFKVKYGPFTTVHQTGLTLGKLFGNYTEQLLKPRALTKEESMIQVYHNALTYVNKNYLEEGLTCEKIAVELGCSSRSLNRAFEGRSLSLIATILSVRLYKGRELLQKRKDLSIERIALMLHFPSAKHFSAQYRKRFHHSPREERVQMNVHSQ